MGTTTRSTTGAASDRSGGSGHDGGGPGEGDSTAGDGTSAGDEPTENELFDILSNRRRRYALHQLTRVDGEVELGPLAEQVAAWENDVAVDEVTSAERKRVYTALQQSHLPKLDEAGVVDFDKRAGTITPTPVMAELDVYLDVVRGRDIPWSEYYLALSAVGAAVLAGAWIDAPVFGVLPDLAWASLVVAAFLCSSIAHVYFTRHVRLGAGATPPDVRDVS
jgi:hypothetical protein